MKKLFNSTFIFIAIVIIAGGCSTFSHLGTWKDSEKLGKNKYEKIFIVAMADNFNVKQIIEKDLANAMEAQGYNVGISSDYFKPNFIEENYGDQATMLNKVNSLGYDGIFTASLIDEKIHSRYVPGHSYYPYQIYRGHGRHWRHYHQYPIYYEPGYYTDDTSYFFENNFYDSKSGDILFSAQSMAINPPQLEKFSAEYASSLVKQLKKNEILN